MNSPHATRQDHPSLKACRTVYAQHIRLAGEAARAGDVRARDSHRMAARAAETCLEEIEFAMRLEA